MEWLEPKLSLHSGYPVAPIKQEGMSKLNEWPTRYLNRSIEERIFINTFMMMFLDTAFSADMWRRDCDDQGITWLKKRFGECKKFYRKYGPIEEV